MSYDQIKAEFTIITLRSIHGGEITLYQCVVRSTNIWRKSLLYGESSFLTAAGIPIKAINAVKLRNTCQSVVNAILRSNVGHDHTLYKSECNASTINKTNNIAHISCMLYNTGKTRHIIRRNSDS